MPELPEVERVRATLHAALVGRTVALASVHRRDVIVAPGDPPGGFSRQRAAVRPKRFDRALLLVGSRIGRVARHGKQLAILAQAGPVVLAHLGMTGAFRLRRPGERAKEHAHVHVSWRLDDGSRLQFRDPRRFGGLWLLPSQSDLDARWGALGPDALSVSAATLERALRGSRAPLKAALLDQARIAGIGNIYADEAAFRARLRPTRPAGALTKAQLADLARALRDVLAKAIEAGGSTLRDYEDPTGQPGTAQHAHLVYGRADRACHVCGQALVKSTVAQRTTVYCPGCQP